MKKNLYTQSVQNIKAPQELIENTLTQIKDNNLTGNVVSFEKPKRKVLKFTSAVAAVLALIIGLSFIPFGGNDSNTIDSKHNFVLKAGAAEITPEAYINAGLLESSFETGHFMVDESGEYILLETRKEYSVDIQCSGENIESVTYTANNGYLSYDPDFEGLLNFTELTGDEIKKYDAGGSKNNSQMASSCTFDYNNQPRSLWDPVVTGFEIPEDCIDGTVPLRMAFTFFFDAEENRVVPYVDGFADTDDVFYNEFNAHADDYSLDVTANFTDGTQVTKTLKFMCDNSMTQLQLLVTEVAQ